ncbi:MAG: STAS domain-containing protein [Deltaproteobacteria bacterium]
MALAIKVYEREQGVFVVALTGALDTSTYEELEEKVRPFLMETTRALVFDLKGLEYISSMGVSAVLKAKKAIEGFGNSFLMINMQPQIKTVFEIIKALPAIALFESLEEADAYLTEMQRRARERAQEEGRS